jgi:quercetin dioxygenase-like cupin family protein
MATPDDARLHTERPAGETSGSAERRAQRLTGTALTFDLAKELDSLHKERAWQRGDRNANTLVKEPALRVVLTALKRGAVTREHGVHGQFTLQTIAGRLRVRIPGQTVDLGADQLLSLESGVTHEVEALEESAFLLTIAGSGGDS